MKDNKQACNNDELEDLDELIDEIMEAVIKEEQANKKIKDYNKLKRQEKQNCQGLSEDGTKCRYEVKDGFKCCSKHKDMENYTDEMFENVKLCKYCSRHRWRYFGDADRCLDCQKKQKEKMKLLCKGEDREGHPCRLKALKDKNFCGRNHAYLENYTEEMMNNRKQCSTCRNKIYIEFFNDHDTCNTCQERAANNREKQRKHNAPNKIYCQSPGCPNSVKDGNVFCGIHVTLQRALDAHTIGKRPCVNFNRKCRRLLDKNYKKKKCEQCLAKARVRDRARYAKKKALGKNKNTKTHNYCMGTHCKLLKPIEEFTTDRNLISIYCKTCRAERNEYTLRRVRRNTCTNDMRIQDIIRCAKRRGIELDLTPDKILELITQACHYCGKYNERINVYGEKYSKMGIDRLDNDGYYTNDNVVTACKTCNYMKYVHNYYAFLDYCINIFENFGSTNDWEPNIKLNRVKLAQHKRDAKKRKIRTELTLAGIICITSKKCYYCNSTNRKKQIGIDRVDSTIGYTNKNKLVACCGICNLMKDDTNIDEFYNNILAIVLHQGYIDQDTYNENFRMIKKPSSKIKQVNEALSKVYDYDGKENKDRRNIHNFQKPTQFYIDNIWKGFDVRRFEPELEFCESQEQIDTWMYYRLTISSHFPSKYSAMNTHILIRDKFTKKYVGITSLCRVRPGWSNSSSLGKVLRNDNVYNITTCVSIPPFSFNFNGGKLMTMLMFSQEVYDYMAKKDIIIAGLMTYSLHGESIQYDGIDNFRMIGYTKGDAGKDNTRVLHKDYLAMKEIMKQKGYPITGNKTTDIKTYCAHQGLIDATVHGVKRGIYFGTTGKNSNDYLMGNTGVFVPNLITVSEIAKNWYLNHVCPRVNDLTKRNKFMVEYDYDTYYADKSAYDRNRKKKSEHKTKTNLRQREIEKQTIVKCWFENQNVPWVKLETIVRDILPNPIENLDRRALFKFIVHNDYNCLDDKTKSIMETHVVARHNFITNKNHQLDLAEKVDVIIDQERRYKNNTTHNPIHVFFKKTRMFITSQKYDNINIFSRFTKLNGILQGNWIITLPTYSNDQHAKNLIKMVHKDYAKSILDTEDTIDIVSSDTIFKLGIAQTDKEFTLSDIDIIDAPIKITGRDNVFVDVGRKLSTNKIRITTNTTYDAQKKQNMIVGITISAINILHHDNISDIQCTCDSCIGFLLKHKKQCNIYKNKYLNALIKKNRKLKESQIKEINDDISSGEL